MAGFVNAPEEEIDSVVLKRGAITDIIVSAPKTEPDRFGRPCLGAAFLFLGDP
jgi:hypothetical protein